MSAIQGHSIECPIPSLDRAKGEKEAEIIKWNNEWRYKRLSEMPDAIQEFMEDYIPQFVLAHLRHHIDYFFDIYDAEEKLIGS